MPPFSEASGAADYEAVSWHVLLAPAGTPKEIVTRLHASLAKVMAMADVKARLIDLGADPVNLGPDEFTAHIVKENEKWRRLVAAAKIGAAN